MVDLKILKVDKQTLIKLLNQKGYTQEDVFERYLNLKVDYDETYTNPLRSDSHPGCRFNNTRSDGAITFVDWARGIRYDMFDVVQKLYNVSYGKAIDIIMNDFGIKKLKDRSQFAVITQNDVKVDKQKQINEFSLKVKRRKFTKQELQFWQIEGLNITEEKLNNNRIYAAHSYWEYKNGKLINECLFVNNVFIYHNGGYNYQLYRPFYDKRRFINVSNLYYMDYDMIKDNYDYVIITKSKKDAFYLRQCGFNAFCITTERIKLSKEFMDELFSRFKVVYTYFDNDRTGKSLSWFYRKEFGTTPFINTFDKKIKDFTNVLQHIGVKEVLKFKTKHELGEKTQ